MARNRNNDGDNDQPQGDQPTPDANTFTQPAALGDQQSDNPQDFTGDPLTDPVAALNEPASPVPADQDSSRSTDNQQQQGAQDFGRRTDAREVQPTPQLTPRTVVMDATQPAAPDDAKTAASSRLVSVGPGQTLTTISRLAYGTETRAGDIFEANRDILISPDTLQVGQTLRLPD